MGRSPERVAQEGHGGHGEGALPSPWEWGHLGTVGGVIQASGGGRMEASQALGRGGRECGKRLEAGRVRGEALRSEPGSALA